MKRSKQFLAVLTCLILGLIGMVSSTSAAPGKPIGQNIEVATFALEVVPDYVSTETVTAAAFMMAGCDPCPEGYTQVERPMEMAPLYEGDYYGSPCREAYERACAQAQSDFIEALVKCKTAPGCPDCYEIDCYLMARWAYAGTMLVLMIDYHDCVDQQTEQRWTEHSLDFQPASSNGNYNFELYVAQSSPPLTRIAA